MDINNLIKTAIKEILQEKSGEKGTINTEIVTEMNYLGTQLPTIPKAPTPDFDPDQYYIVRTYSAGVFAGEIVKKEGSEVVMKNARRIWRWSGAASLSQLAVEGTSSPSECKFPCEVDTVTLLNVIEILPVTEKAKESIKGVPVWEC